MFGFSRKQKEIFRSTSEAIRSGAAKPSLVNWRVVLIWFARIVAMLWLMKGLAAWANMFGLLGKGDEFLWRSIEYQAATVYFAVVDLIAAIGLWMVAAWGGAVWLIAVLSYIVIAAVFQGIVPADYTVSGVMAGLVAVYFLLSWLAAARKEPY